jgi:hypothetical protein
MRRVPAYYIDEYTALQKQGAQSREQGANRILEVVLCDELHFDGVLIFDNSNRPPA